jgi:hypothetical protein
MRLLHATGPNNILTIHNHVAALGYSPIYYLSSFQIRYGSRQTSESYFQMAEKKENMIILYACIC